MPAWEDDILHRFAASGLIAVEHRLGPSRATAARGPRCSSASGRPAVAPCRNLARLVAHALGDLKEARRTDNAYAARRAEQWVNALLDQLRTKVIRRRTMR